VQLSLNLPNLPAHREHKADLVIYTDGSATDGVKNGGAAAILTRGDPALPAHMCGVVHTLQCRGSAFTSSFEEKHEAMKLALNWLADSDHTGTVLICSDSQALLRAIGSCSESAFDLVSVLVKPQLLRTILQWLPGHCGIHRNELADQKLKKHQDWIQRLGRSVFPVQCHVSYRTFSIQKYNSLGRLQFMLTSYHSEKQDRREVGVYDMILLAGVAFH